jgi:hypothetical protein
MKTSSNNGFSLPDSFDVESYDQVGRQSTLVADVNDASNPLKQNAWRGFSMAWNGMALRLRAMQEYDEEFRRQIALGTAPPHEAYFAQEKAHFGCVVSALSAVECFFLAAYCFAAASGDTNFKLANARDLSQTPANVSHAFKNWVPADRFTLLLDATLKSTSYISLSDMRNALAHRGVLPRKVMLSTVADVPSLIPGNPKSLGLDFGYDDALGADTTGRHAEWTTDTLSQLSKSLGEFVLRTFPKEMGIHSSAS